MSIPAANIKNLRFSLRYPPDKIVGVYEGSFTANASSSSFSGERTHNAISHGFSQAVLPVTTYSLDGGTTWQDQNIVIPDLSSPSTPVFQTIEVSAYSTSTQIVVVASSYLGSASTVTFKVIALWID